MFMRKDVLRENNKSLTKIDHPKRLEIIVTHISKKLSLSDMTKRAYLMTKMEIILSIN